jgi:Zn-dependent M28 family amino/carboxypeptidase
LFGSEHYVSSLNEQELKEIAFNINFDMIASPNYIMGVYNGTSSSVQSGNIQKVFEDYFNDNEIPFVLTPFTGRSDYGLFFFLI